MKFSSAKTFAGSWIAVTVIGFMAVSTAAHERGHPRDSESELLRRYLNEVERRSALETEKEVGRFEFYKEIYRANQIRRQRAEDREEAREVEMEEDRLREKRDAQHWQAYREGQQIARQIVGRAKGLHYCNFLKTNLEKLLPPSDKESLNQARRQGAYAEYIECYMEDQETWFTSLKSDIESFKEDVREIHERRMMIKPETRLEERALAKSVEAYFLKVVQDRLPTLQTNLQAKFEISPLEAADLEAARSALAGRIDCTNLRSRYGTLQNCTIAQRPAPLPLDHWAVMRIFYDKHGMDMYRSYFDLSAPLLALATYLRDVQPNDEFARDLGQRFLEVKNRIQTRIERESAQVIAIEKRALDEEIADLDSCSLFQDEYCPSKAERLSLFQRIVALRDRWVAIDRYQKIHELDENKLAALRREFREASALLLKAVPGNTLPPRVQLNFFPSDFYAGSLSISIQVPQDAPTYIIGRSRAEALRLQQEIDLP